MLAGDTYTITTLSDVAVAGTTTDNLWSLREALAHAAADGQADKDVIQFGSLTGTISLGSSGHLVVNDDVEIIGPGADMLTIDAHGASRVLFVNNGVEATISGLTIANGYSGEGAGVLNWGDLALDEVVVKDSVSWGSGGGIQSRNGTSGVASLHVTNSTIVGNRAVNGSGINVYHVGGVLEIEGSTISNNVGYGLETSAYSAGGGLAVGGSSASSVSIANSTFSGNSALYSGGVRFHNNQAPTTIVNTTIAYNMGNESGGLQRLGTSTPVTLHNTIVAENKDHSNVDKDVLGTLVSSSSYNLIGRGGAGGLTDNDANHNLVLTTGETAGLLPLGNNGGSTKTHALLPGSQAFDAGSDAVAASAGVTIDQRGNTRTSGVGVADIGAYELSLVVSTPLDESDGDYTAGDLSLREALLLAAKQSANNQIAFDASLLGGVINLNPALDHLVVGSHVEIIGPGQDLLTIQADGTNRLFSVSSGVEATISGLTITGGDGRPAFVTALGETSGPGGWRENKRDGGVLIDVESNEVVVRGLSMPHSPRWHRGELWMLESGDGSIGRVDLNTGKYEAIARLPGFTRGLALFGPLAFIGLSQVRESAVFSGFPLVERLDERVCGVWVVHIETGETLGFVKFEDAVQEIFAVELLRGIRYPDLINHDPELIARSYVLPDDALALVPSQFLARRSNSADVGEFLHQKSDSSI